MSKQNDLASRIAFHKEQMHIYRTVDKIKHKHNYKAVVRGGEACVIRIDEHGNEIRED